MTDTYSKLLIEAMNTADHAAAHLNASSSSPSPRKKARTTGEALVTNQLKKKLSDLFKLATNSEDFSALTEWYVQDPSTGKRQVKMDLVVYKNGTNGTGYTDPNDHFRRCYDAYAFMELGVCMQEDDESLVELWWEKMDQLLNYLNAICDEKYRGAKRGKSKMGKVLEVPFPKHPVILSVLVWSKSRKTSAIGTFVLEWCGTSNKFRMALLSAEICRDIKATSAAFGKVISLIHELTYLRKENLGEGGKKLAKDVWCYLGPDCAKLGETKVS
jgi:hypothetical protein